MNKRCKDTLPAHSSISATGISVAVHYCMLFYPVDVPKCSQSSSHCWTFSPNLLLLYRSSLMEIYPQKIIQRKKRARCSRKMLPNLPNDWRKARLFHIHQTQLNSSPSQPSPRQAAPPSTWRATHHSTDILVDLQSPFPGLQVPSVRLLCKVTVHPSL